MGSTDSREVVEEERDSAMTEGNDGFLRYGAATDLGGRPTQEDAYWALTCGSSPEPGNWRGFYVVCDGHGGSDAANFVSRNLLRFMLLHPTLPDDPLEALRESFLKTDLEFLRLVKEERLAHSGTTALAAAVLDMRLFVAHVGDCRAILCRNGRAMNLTTDHRPSIPSEKLRIESAGGYIDPEGYLNGDLQVSRALGDFHYTELKKEDKTGHLIAVPEVLEQPIEENDEFVVLTTDGALDVLCPGEIVRIARNELIDHNAPDKAADAVVLLGLSLKAFTSVFRSMQLKGEVFATI